MVEQKHALRRPDASKYIGRSVSAMDKDRVRGNGPAYHKAGRTVVYLIDDLDAWLASRRFTSTSEYERTRRSTSQEAA